ncbi:DUF1127 domain-containing protein [uncultured Cocleimonas sp.]|uniref:DUF1127 domain-containing protein n=1 Tax=uncultured Cocleimonas sp. TaxID=1051587 RepID=UPI0026357000|nr:DUF1127 domain-containing protein [uncultured Cocleimonas sp.]
MLVGKIVNGLSSLVGGINEGMRLSGYARTARELRLLSDKQLADLGISRALLEIGVNAYPWKAEEVSKLIPDNVTTLKAKADVATEAPQMPRTPKAA